MPVPTILHDSHARLGARLIDFGGWDLPVQYEGILIEHQRTRQDVSMFDTCHMDAFRVAGPGALDFLSHMLTQDLRSLADGRCRYGFLLREDAGVLDDLIAYRLSATDWMVVVNAGPAAGDFAWLSRFRPVTGVTLTDLRGVQGKIDVQGPNSRAAVERVLGIDLADLGYFRFRAFGADGLVSRTGYTGEVGYEIFAPLAEVAALWERLLAAGVKPAGLGARDTLRLEAGLPLYGHELSETLSPCEAGMLRYASKAEPFMGRDALLVRQRDAAAPRLAAFAIEGRQSARNGNRVLNAVGDQAGWVTSGSYSPTLGYAIGFAYVRPELAVPGQVFGVDSGRNVLQARVTTAPFVSRK
jgi:aminomethyltransferase